MPAACYLHTCSKQGLQRQVCMTLVLCTNRQVGRRLDAHIRTKYQARHAHSAQVLLCTWRGCICHARCWFRAEVLNDELRDVAMLAVQAAQVQQVT